MAKVMPERLQLVHKRPPFDHAFPIVHPSDKKEGEQPFISVNHSRFELTSPGICGILLPLTKAFEQSAERILIVMKKVLLMLLCMMMTLCLSACGSEPAAQPTSTPVPTVQSTATTVPDAPMVTEQPSATEEPVATAPAEPFAQPLGDSGLQVTLPGGWMVLGSASEATVLTCADADFELLLQANVIEADISVISAQIPGIVESGVGKDYQEITVNGVSFVTYTTADDTMYYAYTAMPDGHTLCFLFTSTDASLIKDAAMLHEIIGSLTATK